MERTSKSREYIEKAKNYLPGGDTRSAAYYKPYPFVADFGKGFRITDIDGNEYLDFVNNFTSLIHGHADDDVVKALTEQTARGTAHGTPVVQQYELTKLICERIPEIELLRYCNSGSEANMFAMRAARCFTGKDAFIRIDGGYNGSFDHGTVNTVPDVASDKVPSVIVEKGIPKSVAQDTFVAPYNDLDIMQDILEKHSDKIAGIIMEPLPGAGGFITPKPGYLKGARELADKYGVLLIFDEVICFRFHEGGYHTLEGVKADVVALGKIIGGGLPVGAFGARKEIMDYFDPSKPGSVPHSGTFSGNAMTMAAGLATLKKYKQPDIDRVNALGDRLRASMKKALNDTGIKGGLYGFGSILNLSFSPIEATNVKQAFIAKSKPAVSELLNILHLAMLNRGVTYVERGMIVLSTAMNEKTVDIAAAKFKDALEEIRPLAEEAGCCA